MKDMLNSKPMNDKEFMKLIEDIVVTEGQISTLEEIIHSDYASSDLKDRSRKQLKTANNRLSKYMKKLNEDTKKRGDISVKYVKEV